MKLFLHRGLSFCDVSVTDDTGQDLASVRFLYSKHRFRSQLETFLKDWTAKITEVILLDEFADRLSGLRLGGSVAAIFPKGLEKITQKIQSSPIHSENMIFAAPDEFSEEWISQTIAAMQKDTTKRVAWQTPVTPEVLARFSEAGFENFVSQNLQPEMILNWRRNILNACCSGPVLELAEDIQSILTNLGVTAEIKWIDEDLVIKKDVRSRYGITSVWTQLIYGWAEKLLKISCDVFVMDWDGCFHIGLPAQKRWTPWGAISTHAPIPNVQLLKVQPTTTLANNVFGAWSWLGKADTFEPGPVFLGRGLKPTVLDLLVSREMLQTQFEVKPDFEDKISRLTSSLTGFKNNDQLSDFKKRMSADVLKEWSQNMLELAQTNNWIVVGPLAELVQSELKNLKGVKIQFTARVPKLSELQKHTRQNDTQSSKVAR